MSGRRPQKVATVVWGSGGRRRARYHDGMATVVDCADPVSLLPGMREARAAISRGDLVVMPTDTVYGIAADAFQPMAVRRLLMAKGRGPDAPPPVLVPTRGTLDALAETVPEAVTALVERFWPGGLTVILPARATLAWDLGDTNGTVALRMPDDRIALELLAETGPLAVSSANLTGQPPATTAPDAVEQLGDVVDVYLDNGSTPGAVPSTIVDATALADGTGPLRIVRLGVISEEDLRAVAAEAFDLPEAAPENPDEPDEVLAETPDAPQPSDQAAAP
ncbi:MAG: threonylcarbamoyl-AMP synthase [Amnibacterium sp.]|nr:threonylcarbamoyl-AMP synthase [Amnibacterium sp.]